MAAFDLAKINPYSVALLNATTSTQKGKALEGYIAELFGQVPGLRVTGRNVVNTAGSQEVDVVFSNAKDANGLPFIDFFFLVECKNRAAKSGAAEIREFTTKLRTRHLELGVFVAVQGITGSRNGQLSHAREAVSSALQDGIRILVLTKAELDGLSTTEDLVTLFQDKIGLLIATQSSI